MRVLTLVFFVSFIGQAQETKLDFLLGSWTLKHEWGDMVEVWTSNGKGYTGMFSCYSEEEPVFYELMVIEQEENGTFMYLRHFNPGSIAWENPEEPISYFIEEANSNFVLFNTEDASSTLEYRLIDPNTLQCTLLNEEEKEVFLFKRKLP